MTEKEYPFWIVADPEQKIYKALEIEGAEDLKNAIDEKALKKIQGAKKLGLAHGEYEGNEDQAPAWFYIDSDMTVIESHYGQYTSDMPLADEALAKIK